MSLTYEAAQDEIMTRFKTKWDAGSPSAGVFVVWPDQDAAPPEGASYAVFEIEHTLGRQGSLSDPVGVIRWERRGLVRVCIYTMAGRGLLLNTRLGMVAVDAFEGKTTPGGVWFRNVRYSEAPGRDGKWQQGNVVAEFTYDQFK
jgi:hypothetical protein